MALSLLLMVLGASAVAAQNGTNATNAQEDVEVDVEEDVQVDVEEPQAGGGQEDVAIFEDLETFPTVADVDRSATTAETVEREASVEQDDVFNALAIANNNDQAIGFGDVADVQEVRTQTQSIQQELNYEDETVFSALALGIVADDEAESDLVVLANAASIDRQITQTTVNQRQFDLDRSDTLLAIALANSGGGELDMFEVADLSQTTVTTQDASQDVQIDEDDAFLALALGHGGGDGNGGDLLQRR